MNIPTNPPPARPDTLAGIPPAVDSLPTGDAVDRRAGHIFHLRNNNMANLLVRGVFGLVDVYRGPTIPSKAQAQVTGMLQLMSANYKMLISDGVTLLGGLARSELRPILSGVKNVLTTSDGVKSYSNGSDFNPYAGAINALGGAVAALFTSSLFFSGSKLKTAGDLALKSGLANLKLNLALDSGAIVKALLAVAMSKFCVGLTQDYSFHRPEAAGTERTKSDKKHEEKLLRLVAYLGGIGAIITQPGIKEPLADLFIKKCEAEIVYDDLLKLESVPVDTVAISGIKTDMSAAKIAAARAKSIRVETFQQSYTVLSALVIFAAITKTLNNADRENARDYMRC